MADNLVADTLPPHVDASRVIEYDLYNDHRYTQFGDVHQAMYRLCEDVGRGIYWTQSNGGHWVVTDHQFMFDAARSPELFSSEKVTIPPVPVEPLLIPLTLDPPVHGAFRMPLMRAFAPQRIEQLEAGIRAFAGELVDAVKDAGRCDFVQAIAVPMPITIFMKIMGMPLERMAEFRAWVADVQSDDDDRRTTSYANVARLMDGLIAERQIERRDDLISQLIDADIRGRKLSYEEIQGYCLLLFAAGLDTVVSSLSFGINHLAGQPALQDRLRSDPAAIPDAVEEFLRMFAVSMVARVAACDFEFRGAQLKQGDRVVLMIPAGNFDPALFPDPMRFDVDRVNKAHLSFNVGPHRCIGSHLARLELRVFYEEWFKRMPNVRHDPERRATMRGAMTFAMHSLPLVWEAAG